MSDDKTIACRQCNWRGKFSSCTEDGDELSGDGTIKYLCPNCNFELARNDSPDISNSVNLLRENAYIVFKKP